MAEKKKRLTDYDPCRFRKKLGAVVCLISGAFFLLVCRLWYFQVIRGDELRQRSENNRIRIQEVKPLRGLIFDTCGTLLVDNQPSFDISIIPEDAKNVSLILENLYNLYVRTGNELPLPAQDLSYVKYRKPFMPIKVARNVEREILAAVETHSLNLPGIVLDIIPVREYIYGEMMAHLLGYVGEISFARLRDNVEGYYKSGDIVGKDGIEKAFDRYLKGVSGGEQIEVNVAGRKLNLIGRADPVPGNNIFLTIDVRLQKVCWDAFQEKAGTAIVMDPRDGSVLAMVSKPSFDPNLFNRGISQKEWNRLSGDQDCPLQNRAILGQYPPGSTYKLIVAAAALEEGIITPETKVLCSGSYRMGNSVFRCWKRFGHGEVDLHKAIVQSCDVYFYSLADQIGVDKLAEYSRRFGLGSRTGIDLPGERCGLVPTRAWKLKRFKDSWQKGETVSLSIGQGFLLMTSLQLLKAYSALANDGIIYKPRIVKKVETPQGKLVRVFLPEKESVLPVKKDNIAILKRALWGAVNDERGTGSALRRAEKDVCGKTGTSQVIGLPEEGADIDEEAVPYKFRDHALFVCFAPFDNPRVAVVVVVEHGGHGGSVAAPIARKIIDGYFDFCGDGSHSVSHAAVRDE